MSKGQGHLIDRELTSAALRREHSIRGLGVTSLFLGPFTLGVLNILVILYSVLLLRHAAADIRVNGLTPRHTRLRTDSTLGIVFASVWLAIPACLTAAIMLQPNPEETPASHVDELTAVAALLDDESRAVRDLGYLQLEEIAAESVGGEKLETLWSWLASPPPTRDERDATAVRNTILHAFANNVHISASPGRIARLLPSLDADQQATAMAELFPSADDPVTDAAWRLAIDELDPAAQQVLVRKLVVMARRHRLKSKARDALAPRLASLCRSHQNLFVFPDDVLPQQAIDVRPSERTEDALRVLAQCIGGAAHESERAVMP